ncbi:MAG TPA: pseudouridine synthase [Fimbriimonadaceae bacterium]|nr:pseudouridine synthase [Fimbriimonadaceae bacterium]
MSDDGRMRLHRYIAQCGVCSRRKAEELIAEGRVSVNGTQIVQQGTKVGPGDVVEVDGQRIAQETHLYLVMYKPKGVLTAMSDERGRQTVADLLPNLEAAVKPVGRLDKDTDGLLLFTNDGDLAKRLTHPSHSIEKVYEAEVRGRVEENALERLRKGVTIERRRTRPAEADIVTRGVRSTRLRIVLREGWKRQVRLMCETVGHPVIELRRVQFGPLRLKGMRPGECRMLGKAEIERLKKDSLSPK